MGPGNLMALGDLLWKSNFCNKSQGKLKMSQAAESKNSETEKLPKLLNIAILFFVK